ncbi:MAG: hypothetical protein HOM55_09885 [Proteobacteria bacterium]|nr:hypothetical protein [Pseudomonadota bacterium]
MLGVTFVAIPGHAHHSDLGLDMESILAFEATVTEFNWRNPHVYLLVETDDGQGNSVEWNIQLGSVSVSQRRGWTSDSVAPGDRVTLRVHPKLNGQPYAVLESLDKEAGGLTFSTSFDTPDGTATTDTIDGKWIADESSYPDYPGGYDGLFRALLKLNETAEQAALAFDPYSTENPNASCTGRPTPGGFVSSNLYLMEFEINESKNIIMLRSERDAEERTVYMDGRAHPDSDEQFKSGHSIGAWEGDTLVVDTSNFPFHRSPYQIGVPSSTRKHVVERYRLNQAGTHLEAEFMLEDPEYLSESMTHSRRLIYSPNMEMFLSECDPESAGRFLD